MSKPKVLNSKTATADELARSVYIGRPSRWGNPFKVGRDGCRAEVIAKYREYLISRPELMKAAKDELAGKDLACWCHPLGCHGDVLVEVANANR